MGEGEALEDDPGDQSFQVVELCLPPKVTHLLQIDSPMETPVSPGSWSLNSPSGNL